MLSYQQMQTFLRSSVSFIHLLLTPSTLSAQRPFNVGYTYTWTTLIAPRTGPVLHSNGLCGKNRVHDLWIMWHWLFSQNGVWRVSTNWELIDLYRELYIISEIRKGTLWWLGHTSRMPEERTVKNVFKNIPEGKMSAEKPRRGGWPMLKTVWGKWVLQAGEK